MWGRALRDHMKRQKELQLERLKAGRFFNVTCEKGHMSQMSGVDLCRRLNFMGEKLQCPACYEEVKVGSITDGPLMNDEQKKKQQEDYLEWSKQKKRERERREHEASVEDGVWM